MSEFFTQEAIDKTIKTFFTPTTIGLVLLMTLIVALIVYYSFRK